MTADCAQGCIETSKSLAVRRAAARLLPGSASASDNLPGARRASGNTGRLDDAAREGAGMPPVIAKGKGAMLVDVDRNEYIDYVCANGALVLGHGDERIVAAVHKAASKGWGFPSLTEMSVRLAELIAGRFVSIDMVRLVNSRADAVAGAVRLARTHAQRDHIVVVEGCRQEDGDGAPVVREHARRASVIPYNDAGAAEKLFREHGGSVAGVIVDPAATGLGLIPPADGFLAVLRDLCNERGSVLVFDESVTGFRVARGGAAALFGVTPDLTCLGPALGGGLPLAAYGGRRDLMALIPTAWGVDHSVGASEASALAIAAGTATLEAMGDRGFYEDLEWKATRLDGGLQAAAESAGVAASHARLGSLVGMSFGPLPRGRGASARNTSVTSSRRAASTWMRFYHALLGRGIFMPPTPLTCMSVSAAHTNDHIDRTIEMAYDVLSIIGVARDE